MKDLVSAFMATALIQLSNIGSGILLARFLQPEGRGELAAVMLWPSMIAAIGILGLHEAVAYHAARRTHGPGRILRASLALGFALSLFLVPIGIVLLDIVFAGYSSEVRHAAFFYLAFIPLNFAGVFLVGLFQGELRFREWNILRTLVHVAYLILIPVFHATGLGGVLGFALASLGANILLVVTALILGARAGWLRPEDSSSHPAPPILRSLLSYGATVHAGAVVGIVAERLDQLIISVALTATDLGLFVVAMTVARLPLVLANTFATVAFPKIAGAAEDTKAAMLARYTRATTFAVLATSPVLALATPWLLPLFFGQAFAAAAPVTWILILGTMSLSLKVMLGSGLKGCNQGLIVAQAEFVTLVVSAAAMAVLVSTYGLIGAAAASAAGQGGALAFLVWRTRRTLRLSLQSLFVPQLADFGAVWREWRRA